MILIRGTERRVPTGWPAAGPLLLTLASFMFCAMNGNGEALTQPDLAADLVAMRPGQRLARGVARLMREMDHATLPEFVPVRGLCVDLMAVSRAGEIWIIECKSSRADYVTDRKWQGYLEWCDRFFWATPVDFPAGLLPADSGLILADAHAAELVQMAPLHRLAAARRHRLIRDLARGAAMRLQRATDPGAPG